MFGLENVDAVWRFFCANSPRNIHRPQMSDTQDFSFIAQQLAWLEGFLRDMPESEEAQRLEAAIASLKRAQAVMLELDHLSNAAKAPDPASGV
jgi:hypothetical protein